jgi:hypothetical protein
MQATATLPRRPLAPVSGSVRILRPLGQVNAATAEIAIDGKPYYLAKLTAGFQLVGFDPKKAKVTSYDLPLDLSSCDCPDHTYRPNREGGCKHMKAVAALKANGKV